MKAGKTTLVRELLKKRPGETRTLDDATTLSAARSDPNRFVAHQGLLAIDEIQRAPELILSIKAKVDSDTRSGQFLLTGSARVLGLRKLPDALIGRMETLELWPFSQGEIDGRVDSFIDRAFSAGREVKVSSAETRSDYIERFTRGGFPEAVRREEGRRAAGRDADFSAVGIAISPHCVAPKHFAAECSAWHETPYGEPRCSPTLQVPTRA